MFLFLVSYLSRLLRTRVEVGWEIVYCCSKVVECALKKDQFFEWAASTELERFSMDLKWERWIGDCSKKTLIAWSLCLRRKPLNLMCTTRLISQWLKTKTTCAWSLSKFYFVTLLNRHSTIIKGCVKKSFLRFHLNTFNIVCKCAGHPDVNLVRAATHLCFNIGCFEIQCSSSALGLHCQGPLFSLGKFE